MLNRKGSTLIESLFAFEIYITILILFLSLLTQLYSGEVRVNKNYQQLLQKEVNLSYQEDISETIKEALH